MVSPANVDTDMYNAAFNKMQMIRLKNKLDESRCRIEMPSASSNVVRVSPYSSSASAFS